MDWTTYRQLSDTPDFWSRWMLEQCIDVFRQLEAIELADKLAAALMKTPLAVPADFKGADAALMYRLALEPELRRQGLSLMQQAVNMNLQTPLTESRGLGGFVAVWREYAQVCSEPNTAKPQ